MDKWNAIERLDFIFCRLYATWEEIDIDFKNDPPDSLTRLVEAADKLCDALVEFKHDMERE